LNPHTFEVGETTSSSRTIIARRRRKYFKEKMVRNAAACDQHRIAITIVDPKTISSE
jgi:hypothetical protein